MTKIKVNRFISILLTLAIMMMFFVLMSVEKLEVSATQSKAGNFSKNYTLTGNGNTDMANIGLAQQNKTQAQLGYTDASVSANDLYPDVKTKSGTVTMYAQWEADTNSQNNNRQTCGINSVMLR